MTPGAALREIASPAGILVAAWLLASQAIALPPSFSGLRQYGPHLSIALGLAVSIAFKRGRPTLAFLTLAAAQVARQWYLQAGSAPGPAYTVFAALCVFVPFNLAALGVLKERGIFNLHGVQRTAVLFAEIALVAWMLRSRHNGFAETVYATLVETRLFARSPLPQVALLAIVLGFATAAVTWFLRRTAIDFAFAGAILAFALAANGVTSPHAFETYVTAAAVILTVAVLQDTFRMAFRDELTGLPSRRALNERLTGLPRRYAIAMMDVDRFKGLNDRFGHDVGDQVLKMVGTRLARVGGGGRVYRYGGEEFSVIFPGKSADEALPYLEALRQDIAGYRLSLRDPARGEKGRLAKERRGEGAAGRHVSVTISIGVAEAGDVPTTPEEVIQAADRALYRAKRHGRNQVSR